MRIRRHLSYANVTATLALFLALAGGAYAVGKVRSHDIANGAVRSIDLRNRKGVKAVDVKRNTLTGREISEHRVNAEGFAPVAGDEAGDCNPSSAAFVDCATTTLRLKQRSRLLVVATGGEDSVGGPASSICEIRVDDALAGLPGQPGEETADNTSGTATNGFARTVVIGDRLATGKHKVALACNEYAGNVRIDVPTIAVIAIGAR
jgi:hypothetical protein